MRYENELPPTDPIGQAVAEALRDAVAEALRDAADNLEALVDGQHPDAVNPDQWLRDRADRIERGQS